MPPRKLRGVVWAMPAAIAVAVAVALVATLVSRRAPARTLLAHTMHPWAGAGLPLTQESAKDEAPKRCPAEPPIALAEVALPAGLELARAIREEPERLGSASIGAPTRGRLWGAARLVASDDIAPEGDQPWGTVAVVRSIERAAREVRRCFAATPRLAVGDISRKEGGWLRPHRSHQSGLDADVGYYYSDGEAWFLTATPANLDRPRTWALVRALLDGGNVESIFMDRAVQRMLREYAESLDEPGPALADVFESKERRHDVVIHHEPGHATHFHVRFRDPTAAALGARLASFMTSPRSRAAVFAAKAK